MAAYIRSQDGWEPGRRYSDQMTGSTRERPDLQRALADARAGRFDLLLVYRVDRLARSVRRGVDLIQDPSGRVYCLEVNAAPGMSEQTLRSLYAHVQQTLRGRLEEAS